MDNNFPKKEDEENKISVDIINDDQALAAEFNKMTVDEKTTTDEENLEKLKNRKIELENKDPEKIEKKGLINSIGSAFSSISTKLESNIGKVLEDPNKRALFYAGTDMIDKASRITPITSGRAQSPFGIVTSS
jgi:hypothetical protein